MVVRTDTTDRAAQAITRVATTGTTKDRSRHTETEETRALGEVRAVQRPTERLLMEAAEILGLERHLLAICHYDEDYSSDSLRGHCACLVWEVLGICDIYAARFLSCGLQSTTRHFHHSVKMPIHASLFTQQPTLLSAQHLLNNRGASVLHCGGCNLTILRG